MNQGSVFALMIFCVQKHTLAYGLAVIRECLNVSGGPTSSLPILRAVSCFVWPLYKYEAVSWSSGRPQTAAVTTVDVCT